MKKDIAKKWIKALRSKKYKQGQLYLKQVNYNGQAKHCCLGVLCELYNDNMKKNHKKTLSTKVCTKHSTNCVTFNRKEGELPAIVMKWAGINDSIGRFEIEDRRYGIDKYCLADLNDTGKSFKTIANLIEKNMESL